MQIVGYNEPLSKHILNSIQFYMFLSYIYNKYIYIKTNYM